MWSMLKNKLYVALLDQLYLGCNQRETIVLRKQKLFTAYSTTSTDVQIERASWEVSLHGATTCKVTLESA